MAYIDAYLGMFRAIAEDAAGLRRPGSAALDLAWLAAGRTDGFFELGLQEWDMAAGTLLITEAGGLVGDVAGGHNHLTGATWWPAPQGVQGPAAEDQAAPHRQPQARLSRAHTRRLLSGRPGGVPLWPRPRSNHGWLSRLKPLLPGRAT